MNLNAHHKEKVFCSMQSNREFSLHVAGDSVFMALIPIGENIFLLGGQCSMFYYDQWR